jgi:outer membrane receptor protein involved in Fe transport
VLYRRRANNSLCRLFAPVMLLFAAIAASAASAAEVTFPFNLPEQALADTLKAIARQTATSIVFAPETAEHITAPAIRGTYTTEQAVTKALFGTTLQFQKPAPNSILIEPSERSSPGAPAADSSGAQAASSPATRSAPADMNSAYRPILQEIVVTSTRREESLSKVPLSVVATNQETLDKQGVRAMDDLMRLTPGVTFGQTAQFYGTGQSAIAIRGIQSTSGIPTTGVYIDDTPVQARSGVSPSLTNPYPEIFDLDRVEVLRGPQGTLFGTGSVGGAVRFITPEPSLDRASMYARSEMASTDNGGMSYEAGLAGGAPIVTDKLGFRASVWHRSDGGYIDRLDRTTRQLAQRDINDGERP